MIFGSSQIFDYILSYWTLLASLCYAADNPTTMTAFFTLVTASLGVVAAANFDLLAPRNMMIEEAPPMYKAHPTVTETVHETATEHDVSTQIQYTTQFVTKTDVSTFTTSYPVTLTSLINCTKKPVPTTSVAKRMQFTHPKQERTLECDTVTTTEWKTVTATDHVVSTKTVLVPTVSIVPTTVSDIETVTQIRNQSVTMWVPTTYTATITRTSKCPVVVTSGHDVTVTTTATATETVVTTLTTSYPVVTHDAVTRPGPTISLPVVTVTETAKPTKIMLCPSPTGLHRRLDPDSDLTFGCRPGTVCIPPMPDGCNMWPGPPSDDFLCCESDCKPSLPFTPTHWRENETSYYPQSYGYFNLDPTAFGLSYDIFKEPADKHALNSRDESRSVLKRAVPMQCFDECNNTYIVAEAGGKTDELCRDGSAFRVGFDLCQSCIHVHADALKKPVDDYVEPVFAQFLNFCKGRRSEPTKTPVVVSPAPSNPPGPDSEVASRPLETSSQASASSGGFEPAPRTKPIATGYQPSSAPVVQSSMPVVLPEATPSVAPPATRPSPASATNASGEPARSSGQNNAGQPSSPVADSSGISGTGASNANPSGSAADASARVPNSAASGKTDLGHSSENTHTTGSDQTDFRSAAVSHTINSMSRSGDAASVTGSGTAATSTPGGSPPVVVNGAVRRCLSDTAQTLLVALLIFILV
ncbi:hypothetical protein PWT90_00956 [Aphanocladium album]|nr:hypothetical protein PWT90_00956 [Aphanocladium album]